MADFQTSTHRSKWIFTPSELLEKRKASNQRAIRTLEKYGTTHLEVDIDGSISNPEPVFNQNDNAERSSRKPLSCEDEQNMRIFYEQKIQEVCAAFLFPHKIQIENELLKKPFEGHASQIKATALIYFKRFYLQWSVMEHQPKQIMLTCIYASCKVEENHVSAEELGKGIQQDHQVILNNEMAVLQSLDFDLIVYAPYRSIEGFIEDMQEFSRTRNDEINKFKGLRETAIAQVDKIMLTDAPLLYPPGLLALAALRKSNETHIVLDFERYLDILLSRLQFANSTSELMGLFDNVEILIANFKVPTPKDMRHIDRKLKNCWDPSSQDENKKREKKSKHRSKKTEMEMQGTATEM